jgi:hypothetical protein
VGKNRAEGCLLPLKELNLSSTVVVDNSDVSAEMIKRHKVLFEDLNSNASGCCFYGTKIEGGSHQN